MKIKIGQLGIAHDHAEGKMSCVRKYPEIFEVVGFAEQNPENVKKNGGMDCYKNIPFMQEDELLSYPGLDAVMVETEELLLVKTAQKCIDKNLHVHLDKPAGGNTADFEKLLDCAKNKNLAVQLAYMYRYNPAVQYCLEAIKNGKLGEIYQVDAVMNSWYPPEKREWTNKFPGGNMFYLGCHMIDLILLMQGLPEKIIPMNKSTGIDGINAVDHGFAVLEYKNGISIARAALTECDGYERRQLVVCGEKGTIEIKPLEIKGIPTSRLQITNHQGWDGGYKGILLPESAGRYDTMMLEFAQIIRGEKQNPFTYEYELNVQKAVMAACGE